MSASEVWWLVAAILAGLGGLLVLLAGAPVRTAPGTPERRPVLHLDRLGRFLVAAAVGATALGFLVLP